MKSAILPQVRVEPELRADLESVLREGETLSDSVAETVRGAVAYRRMQMEFEARADAAWTRLGAGRPAQAVIADLRTRLDGRRRELAGRHKPDTP